MSAIRYCLPHAVFVYSPPMTIALEDAWEDVIGKAVRGLGKDSATLARESGLTEERVSALLNAQLDVDALRQIAPALHLDPATLVELARGNYHPNVAAPEGLLAFNFAFPVPGYEQMHVNAYIVHAPGDAHAVVFDCGGNPDELLAALREKHLSTAAIFLTHTHRDHVAGIEKLIRETGARLYAPANEPWSDASPVAHGDRLSFGPVKIAARDTSGHSPGGLTYEVHGTSTPIAVVGDALFAGSVGGAHAAWTKALQRIRKNILSLPEETVLCPGHGPITTVANEIKHNPLFPELK